MSVQKEDQDKAFRQWKIDVDKRCDEYIRNQKQKLLPPSKDNFEIKECLGTLEAWCVYKNGQVAETFYGKRAHREAMKFLISMIQ